MVGVILLMDGATHHMVGAILLIAGVTHIMVGAIHITDGVAAIGVDTITATGMATGMVIMEVVITPVMVAAIIPITDIVILYSMVHEVVAMETEEDLVALMYRVWGEALQAAIHLGTEGRIVVA